MTISKVMGMLAFLALTACGAEQFNACSKNGSVCVEGVATGARLDGKRVTAWQTTTPNGVSYAQETSAPLGGDLARIGVSTILPTVINAAVALEGQCHGDCGGGAGITLNVAGGQAVAQSQSSSDNTVGVDISVGGLCPAALMVNGVCPTGTAGAGL